MKNKPLRIEINLSEEENRLLLEIADKLKRNRKNLLEQIITEYIKKNSNKMKNVILIFISVFWTFSCTKEVIKPIDLVKIDPNIAKVKSIEIELPYGNEFYANNKDATLIKIHCYDSLKMALPISQKIDGNLFTLFINNIKVDIHNNSNYHFKTSIPNSYKLTVGINNLKKDVLINAIDTTKPIKKEFGILFRLINVNYDNIYFENTLKHLNKIYNETNNTDLSFKLADYDQNGNLLNRKGVIQINNTVSLDNNNVANNYIDYGGDIDNYVRVYIVNNMNINNSGEYYSSTNSIFLNANFFNDKNKMIYANKDFSALIAHELGHYFGLAHIFRNDDICKVQEGVNDLEAYNIAKQDTKISQQAKYISNCGKMFSLDNIMSGGGKSLSKDQIQVIHKSNNFLQSTLFVK